MIEYVEFPRPVGTMANAPQRVPAQAARPGPCAGQPARSCCCSTSSPPGLTPSELDDIAALLRRIRDDGTTILMVEHVMRLILDLCDRLSVLQYGELIAHGDATTVAQDERVREAYLGTQLHPLSDRGQDTEERVLQAHQRRSGLRPPAGPVGGRPPRGGGRVRRAPRAERCRQDDDAAHDRGLPAADPRLGHVPRQVARRRRAPPGEHGSGSATSPRASTCSRRCRSTRTCSSARTPCSDKAQIDVARWTSSSSSSRGSSSGATSWPARSAAASGRCSRSGAA